MLSSARWARPGFADLIWAQAQLLCKREFSIISPFGFHWFPWEDFFFNSLSFCCCLSIPHQFYAGDPNLFSFTSLPAWLCSTITWQSLPVSGWIWHNHGLCDRHGHIRCSVFLLRNFILYLLMGRPGLSHRQRELLNLLYHVRTQGKPHPSNPLIPGFPPFFSVLRVFTFLSH
jgi:hypothetical protein